MVLHERIIAKVFGFQLISLLFQEDLRVCCCGRQSIRARISRAQHLLVGLEQLGAAIIAELRARIYRSREGNDSVRRHFDPTSEVPFEYGIRVGEIVHNLRSRLDHAIWALVRSFGKDPSWHTAFPVTADSSGFDNDVTRRNLQGKAPETRAIIRLNQPWCGARDGYSLHALNSLSNVDKHRHTNISAVFPEDMANHELPPGSTIKPVSGVVLDSPLREGKDVMRISGIADAHGPGIQLQIEFSGDCSERPYSIPQ